MNLLSFSFLFFYELCNHSRPISCARTRLQAWKYEFYYTHQLVITYDGSSSHIFANCNSINSFKYLSNPFRIHGPPFRQLVRRLVEYFNSLLPCKYKSLESLDPLRPGKMEKLFFTSIRIRKKKEERRNNAIDNGNIQKNDVFFLSFFLSTTKFFFDIFFFCNDPRA